MTNVMVTGLTSLGDFGSYETQLGNAAILMATFPALKEAIRGARLFTTIQLTDEFCVEYGVARIARPRSHGGRVLRNALKFAGALADFGLASVTPAFRHTLNGRLGLYAEMDIVLDFNGDIFPTDTHPVHVTSHALIMTAVRKLGVPVIEFASSPGPFRSPFTRWVSRFMYNSLNLIINREPYSTNLLRQIAIRTPIINSACPAFMLRSSPANRSREILTNEGLVRSSHPLVGMTLAGYNLHSYRTWDIPPTFDDLSIYVRVVRQLVEELDAEVLLIPHVYRKNPWTGQHIQGPDYVLLRALRDMAPKYKNDRVRVLDGIYSPSEVKGVIGQCDMYLSGRLHAGIAAMSQGVPTLLLAYGHKHYGIASLVGQAKYVCSGRSAEEASDLLLDLWRNRSEVHETLVSNMAIVPKLLDLMFRIIGTTAADPSAAINPDNVRAWQQESKALYAQVQHMC